MEVDLGTAIAQMHVQARVAVFEARMMTYSEVAVDADKDETYSAREQHGRQGLLGGSGPRAPWSIGP